MFDMNDTDSDSDSDDEYLDAVADTTEPEDDVEDPHPCLPEPPVAAAKKKRRLNELDNLTYEYFGNGPAAFEAAPYASKRARKDRGFVFVESPTRQATRKRKVTSKRGRAKKGESAPAVKAPRPRPQWSPGDRVEAKFAANRGGRTWYTGVIKALSDDGRRCDIAYDDGDEEARVPIRLVRAPKAHAPPTTAPLTTSSSELPKQAEDVTTETDELRDEGHELKSVPAAIETRVKVEQVDQESRPDAQRQTPPESPEGQSLLPPCPTVQPPLSKSHATQLQEPRASPSSTLEHRQAMIDYLLKDLAQYGLTADSCAAIVDAIGCNRALVRRVRFNLKDRSDVARAYACGGAALESIADLSAFTRARAEPKLVTQPVPCNSDAVFYRYRNGQYLPYSCD